MGGSTELASLLIKAEVTESRTLLNLHDLTQFLRRRSASRPRAVAGTGPGFVRSPPSQDWTNDSGEPGDKYDPELAGALQGQPPPEWSSTPC